MRGYTNYNAVAWFYDGLSKLAFGSTIKKSQIELLTFIPAKSNILIVGGGTGWILEEITKLHPSGLNITYIDSSSRMIERSKNRNYASNIIQFMETSIEEVLFKGNNYDVVITPFFMDCFPQSVCQLVFDKLNKSLKTKGLWLYTDFYLNDKSPLWQKSLIKLLYLFFRLTCSMQVTQLPLLDNCFSPYKPIAKRTYFAGFIVSQVFEK